MEELIDKMNRMYEKLEVISVDVKYINTELHKADNTLKRIDDHAIRIENITRKIDQRIK